MRSIEKKASLKPHYPCVNMGGGLHIIKYLRYILPQNLRNVTKKLISSAVLNMAYSERNGSYVK